MKKITYICVALSVALSSCNKKETLDPQSVIHDDTDTRTALDTYIQNEYINPYNIEVNYKYVDINYELGRYLYPPTESKVQPFLEMIKYVWLGAYQQVAGTTFVSQVAPRQISLIGGRNLDPQRNPETYLFEETLGQADNGAKITIARVDYYDPAHPDEDNIRHIIHTIQHEYCHIVNQHKPFAPEFGKITPDDYSSSWHGKTTAQANALGFITNYAAANPFEDFAEMTSHMLMKSKAQWDAALSTMPEKGKVALKKKEAFIVEYFRAEWGIDFYQLQRVAYQRMQNYL